jgi:hypothetical protein
MKPAAPVNTAGNNHPLVWLKHGLTILHRKEATPVLSVKRRDWGSTGMNRAIGRGGGKIAPFAARQSVFFAPRSSVWANASAALQPLKSERTSIS